jgi:alpha-tubulin suppressor-like RCC1 family protein
MAGKDINGLFAGNIDNSGQKLKDDYLIPVPISAFATIKLRQVCVGEKVCAAISEFGELHWWGAEGNGKVNSLGAASSVHKTRPKMVSVACGLEHMVALAADGHAYCWGSNNSRQLGQGQPGKNVETPTLMHLPESVSKIACGDNSTALLAVSGTVYACGTLVGQQDVQPISEISTATTAIKDIACSDFYLAVVNRYGDAHLWHRGAVPFLDATSKEAKEPVVRIFQEFSVRRLLCGADFILCLTDVGALHSWGRSCLQLGLGELRSNKAVVGPKMLGTFSARFVSSGDCGASHVGAVVLPSSATRQLIAWELVETERIYLRSLHIILQVYKAQAKQRSALAKMLVEVEAMVKPHLSIMAELDECMQGWSDAATCFGPLFQRLSSKKFIEMYIRFERLHSEWSKKATAQFQPGGKRYTQGEQLLPEVMKVRKTESSYERKKPVHLIGLLKEPLERVREYFWLCSRLRSATPEWHPDTRDLIACAESFQRELAGYCSEHEMMSMTVTRLQSDKEELLKKLAILSSTNDNLFLSRNNHEMQTRDLTELLEQHEHKMRTVTRETEQLKEKMLGLFLERRVDNIRRRRAEATAQRAREEADLCRTEMRKLQHELEASRSMKLYRELQDLKRALVERDRRILELETRLVAAEEAQLEQRYTEHYVSNLEKNNERLARELEASRTQLVQQIRRQHSPIEAVEPQPQPAPVSDTPIFANDGTVRGGTVQGLVNLLVSLEDKAMVQPYLTAFFYTYRIFITPIELAYQLQELYCKIPKNSDPPTQWSRVLGVVRYWITEHVDDFQSVKGLKQLLWSFLEETVCVTLSPSTADAITKVC